MSQDHASEMTNSGAMTRTAPPLWVWWIALVWIISFPWTGFTRVPQWKRVHYLPLSDPADKLRDIGSNVLLFVPFGYSIARPRRVLGGLLIAAAAAVVVSMSAEATQLFSTRRYPSATDVASAVIGSSIGAAFAKVFWRRPQTL